MKSEYDEEEGWGEGRIKVRVRELSRVSWVCLPALSTFSTFSAALARLFSCATESQALSHQDLRFLPIS